MPYDTLSPLRTPRDGVRQLPAFRSESANAKVPFP